MFISTTEGRSWWSQCLITQSPIFRRAVCKALFDVLNKLFNLIKRNNLPPKGFLLLKLDWQIPFEAIEKKITPLVLLLPHTYEIVSLMFRSSDDSIATSWIFKQHFSRLLSSALGQGIPLSLRLQMQYLAHRDSNDQSEKKSSHNVCEVGLQYIHSR